MDFEHQFKRSIGSNTFPAIGSDSAPSTNQTAPTQDSCLGSYKSQNTSGVPVKALLISYTGPNSAANMSANIYVRDETAQTWLLWSGGINLQPSQLTSVTMPAPVSQRGTPLSVEYFILIANTSSANGTYVFDIQPGM